MPQPGWSAKRERQYEHIKEGIKGRGESEDTAEEIAARTVNKERARAGEARESSRTSTDEGWIIAGSCGESPTRPEESSSLMSRSESSTRRA